MSKLKESSQRELKLQETKNQYTLAYCSYIELFANGFSNPKEHTIVSDNFIWVDDEYPFSYDDIVVIVDSGKPSELALRYHDEGVSCSLKEFLLWDGNLVKLEEIRQKRLGVAAKAVGKAKVVFEDALKQEADKNIKESFKLLSNILWETNVMCGWDKVEYSPLEAHMMIITEVVEATEAVRNRELPFWVDEHGKPEGEASEIADALIRIINYATSRGWNLIDIILKKNKYNQTRGLQHGGKLK